MEPLTVLGDYYTLEGAAQRLGTTRHAVYFYIRRHHIPVKRIGRSIMVCLADLAAMKVPAGTRGDK